MSYKIGDKVKILKEEYLPNDRENIFPCFIDEMLKYCGKDGVIVNSFYDSDEDMTLYTIAFEFENNINTEYDFAEWMFEKSVKNEIEEINLSDFDTLESLLDYVRDKYGKRFDKKIARKKFLELQPTEEEIEVLQMLNYLGGSLFYDNGDSFVIVNGKAFKMKMFERFEEIMDYLEFTDNVCLSIKLLLGESEEK